MQPTERVPALCGGGGGVCAVVDDDGESGEGGDIEG